MTQTIATQIYSVEAKQLVEQLKQHGYDSALIANEEDLLKREKKPDVFFIELSPNATESAYALCNSLRQQQAYIHTPILLLGDTERNGSVKSINYLLNGLDDGANYFVCRPYFIEEVLSKLKASLRLKTSLELATELTEQLNDLNQQFYHRNIQVEKELYITRQLQQSLLPKVMDLGDAEHFDPSILSKVHYQDEKIRVSGVYLPCDTLGGDLYDVLVLPDNRLGVSISDVSGHGVPAGFVTAIFKTVLHRIANLEQDPSVILQELNDELCSIVTTGDYVTGVYTQINLETLTFTYAGAGHPYPFYYQAGTKTWRRLTENGTPLVWVKGMVYQQESLLLSPGDKIYLFTDGVSEIKNLSDDLYGEERLTNLLDAIIRNEEPYLLDAILAGLSDFTEGAPIADDISMVLIEVL